MNREVRETVLNLVDFRKGWNIRVWREWPEAIRITFYNMNTEKTDIHNLVVTHHHNEMADLAEEILKLDRVNAVEVKLMHGGDGVVLYKEWP